jgi:hypothetical protein
MRCPAWGAFRHVGPRTHALSAYATGTAGRVQDHPTRVNASVHGRMLRIAVCTGMRRFTQVRAGVQPFPTVSNGVRPSLLG